VLAYRLILFRLPLLAGGIAFDALCRALAQSQRSELCDSA